MSFTLSRNLSDRWARPGALVAFSLFDDEDHLASQGNDPHSKILCPRVVKLSTPADKLAAPCGTV